LPRAATTVNNFFVDLTSWTSDDKRGYRDTVR
jgi:hypothetical protein